MFLVDSLSNEELRKLVVDVFPLLNEISMNKVECQRKRDYGRRATRKDMMFNVGMEKFSDDQHMFILSCLMTEFISRGRSLDQDFVFLVKCLGRSS